MELYHSLHTTTCHELFIHQFQTFYPCLLGLQALVFLTWKRHFPSKTDLKLQLWWVLLVPKGLFTLVYFFVLISIEKWQLPCSAWLNLQCGWTVRWAIVKDPSVAKKMAKFIENATIGVCRDAQVRAAGLLRATIKGYTWSSRTSPTYHSWNATDLLANRKFFHLGMVMLAERWAKVRSALAANPMFRLPPPSQPARCSFLRVDFPTHPGTHTTNPACQCPHKKNRHPCNPGAPSPIRSLMFVSPNISPHQKA